MLPPKPPPFKPTHQDSSKIGRTPTDGNEQAGALAKDQGPAAAGGGGVEDAVQRQGEDRGLQEGGGGTVATLSPEELEARGDKIVGEFA